jgi:hypothetical protein
VSAPVCRFCGHPMTSPLVAHSGAGCYVAAPEPDEDEESEESLQPGL